MENEVKKTQVALALGSGGARGYAHIGVIQELEERGFEIVGVAGTSMGAVVGGAYAAGRLEPYAGWVRTLTQRDVLGLLDPALAAPGVVRAQKVLRRMTDLVGDIAIEDLPIPFTAVAADLLAQKEVWFQRGRLDAAIRASIAIPGLITPVVMRGRLLADGGLLNPLPLIATAGIPADLTVAVSVSADPANAAGTQDLPLRVRAGTMTEAGTDTGTEGAKLDRELMRSLPDWLDNLRGRIPGGTRARRIQDAEDPFGPLPPGLRTLDVFELALDTLRSVVARHRLAVYPPDVLITVPRNACGTMDFHRAEEMIELGRRRAQEVMDGEAEAGGSK